MARGIARQMSFAEEEWELARRIYRGSVNSALTAANTIPSAPMTIDPRACRNTPHDQLQNNLSASCNAGIILENLYISA